MIHLLVRRMVDDGNHSASRRCSLRRALQWSNAKKQWAVQRPMDCEERLITQAAATKSVNSATNVFVYRNLVKALPWFSTVREKLQDPAYSGFFLKFKPGACVRD